EKNILANGGQTVNIAGAYRREGTAVYVDMIEVGGKELNFATAKKDSTNNVVAGQYDLTQGVLKDIFGGQPDATGVASLVGALNKAAGELAAASDTDHTSSTYKGLVTALEKAANAFTVTDFINISSTSTETNNLASIKSLGLEYLAKALQQKVTTATSETITAGASLGASKKQIENQIDYVSKLMDAVDKGVGALVDADMNAESARLASLQVQQQLGIQALSIANQNSQNILALFRQ
ncbi:flagellin, partial [uncultured Bartonella sp.]|uniref:flagellin n=1 Tax=uncultured Bartonella sp. TaxID=104108 RepID=UPI002604C4F2